MIKKGDTVFTVLEFANKWKVNADNGRITLEYNVPKELCATFDELRDYILSNDIF